MNLPPLSMYVHLPWCVQKCPYCDFNSYTAGDRAPRSRYLDALLRDLEAQAPLAADRSLISVFLGGGTPSLFSPDEIDRLLAAIEQRYALAGDIEITMEANPGTVECGQPAGYRAAGVNRFSIGAQSFSDEKLTVLGRIHSAADIVRAVEDAQAAGFDAINVDIMHGLPGQTVDDAVLDLEAAVALEPDHISWYQLTLEPNTVFYARPPRGLPDEDTAFEIADVGHAVLESHGFRQYEVSAYARDGRRCRHNVNYWSFGDYLAIGAGAHGKLTTADGVARYQMPANPQSYMRHIESGGGAPLGGLLDERELVFEFMLNASRLTHGFDDALFESRTSLDAGVLERAARTAVAKKLLERPGRGRWQPSPLGRRFLNDLQAEFLHKNAD